MTVSVWGKSTRIGISQEANLFTADTNLFAEIKALHSNKALHCILIDEAQFLTKTQVYQLSDVVDKLKIPVLCYGLRTDFQAELFEGSKYLLAWADELEELKTICDCGKSPFCRSIKWKGEAIKDGEQIQIGGNDRYLCLPLSLQTKVR